MWSNTQSRHASGYKQWAGLRNTERTPTFSQNLKYFFNYQIGWSYLRYFMWNFAGRQNDYMNMDGNSLHGNWESGISFIDNIRLGTPDNTIAPDHLANNKAKIKLKNITITNKNNENISPLEKGLLLPIELDIFESSA